MAASTKRQKIGRACFLMFFSGWRWALQEFMRNADSTLQKSPVH
jgi:hypothetical protein